MKKRYIVLLVMGGMAAAPLVRPATRKIKEKVANWHDSLTDWMQPN